MKVLIIAAIILIIGFFYIFTIREGHNWGDDFAMYIRHAKNIAEGTNYRIGDYIYPPANVYRRSYPPVFPLLLSPIYKFFGLNLKAMKAEIIFFFLSFLFAFFLIFKNDLPFKYLAAVVCIIGFNPYFWDVKDNIMSDIPFILFLYLPHFHDLN